MNGLAQIKSMKLLKKNYIEYEPLAKVNNFSKKNLYIHT